MLTSFGKYSNKDAMNSEDVLYAPRPRFHVNFSVKQDPDLIVSILVSNFPIYILRKVVTIIIQLCSFWLLHTKKNKQMNKKRSQQKGKENLFSLLWYKNTNNKCLCYFYLLAIQDAFTTAKKCSILSPAFPVSDLNIVG